MPNKERKEYSSENYIEDFIEFANNNNSKALKRFLAAFNKESTENYNLTLAEAIINALYLYKCYSTPPAKKMMKLKPELVRNNQVDRSPMPLTDIDYMFRSNMKEAIREIHLDIIIVNINYLRSTIINFEHGDLSREFQIALQKYAEVSYIYDSVENYLASLKS